MEQELLILPQHPSSPPVVSGVRVTWSLVLCVCFVDYCLSFCPFSFGHCVVCSSSIYGYTAIFGCITNCNQMKCNKIFLNFNVIFLFHMVGGLFCLFCLITYTDIYLHDLVPCCDKRNNFPDKTILCTIVCIVVLFLLAFALSVLTFVLSVLTFVLSVLTFVLSVLTSVLPVLTFVLPVLTSVLPVLAFVLSVLLLQLTVSDYYHFGIFNIFLDLTEYL